MPDITFHCPMCQSKLIVDSRGTGRNVPCPECDEIICIPPLEEAGDDVESTGLVESHSAEADASSAITCTRCGKNMITSTDDIADKCIALGIKLKWGGLGPTLDLGHLAATGINGIYQMLTRSDSGDANMFQSIIGTWAPYEQCQECGEHWCHECIKGPLPDKHLTGPPHCMCT